jgi:glycosyltransferase involved in cell wall biosynthesis
VVLCFVNDGSTDQTLDILNSFKTNFKKQVFILDLKTNSGKAEAVRQGMLWSNLNINHQFIAYLDADLATSLEECTSMVSRFQTDLDFVFGSRIMKIGSQIERKQSRFLIGRIVATFISRILKLQVYDTQCGCKLFRKKLSQSLFNEPFISKWLFDVEIFQRIIVQFGRDRTQKKILEVPLKRWIDQGESKVKMTYFFKLWFDLYKIRKAYSKKKLKTATSNTDTQ